MKLIQALRSSPTVRLAFVGAGGKTSALFQLARELLEVDGDKVTAVLVTTTTHLAAWQVRLADHAFAVACPDDIHKLTQDMLPGVVLLTGAEGRDSKLCAPAPLMMEKIHDLAEVFHLPLLVEADGARLLPLKAPGENEPAIPGFVTQVGVVAGLSGLGKPLSEAWVHRSQRFANLSGIAEGDTITPEALVKVLMHPQGGIKSIPPGARRNLILTQADSPELLSTASSIAMQLQAVFHQVLICSTDDAGLSCTPSDRQTDTPPRHALSVRAVFEPVAGIVLAAGGSKRFGSPKQLLNWHGQPFVRQAALTALEAGCSPVVVVTGAYAGQVEAALDGLDVRIANNPNWENGQASSVQAGLRLLSPETGAAVFLLSDQPQVPPTLVRALIEVHRHELNPILAPLVDGQRGNPVLFDRIAFPDLLDLKGDQGGRTLFSRYPVSWLPWQDASLLLDVDTPEAYQALLELKG